ncbi:oxidoreductase [Leptolyngbya sp. BL0902]|uniref:SDR family oxidoreductase n=1 Tax=Leptolyngbya sp. BL0902 TaxID=1115757 RepID=UPI0018E8714F|nr:SDR family oxidoreductase [Leptolyngbya sp. BL0902]QQE63653.1 oxidoreductase [Leptolyngbya sp. BL0902]
MGKRVVITGASRGLGRALAEALIAEGHQVAGCARGAEAVNALADQYPDHHFTAVDISNAAAVQTWSTAVLDQMGVPDLVLNNAGLVNTPAPLWQVPAAEFEAVVAVNLVGTVNVLRSFAPAMIQRGSGIFVNYSSGWGRSTSPEFAPYCATKWAIEGLTQAFAQELPPGMAAVALNPGIIHTDMLETCYGEAAASFTPIAQWVKAALPFILNLKPQDNGRSLSVPGSLS